MQRSVHSRLVVPKWLRLILAAGFVAGYAVADPVPCAPAPLTTYQTAGFTCAIGGIEFEHFQSVFVGSSGPTPATAADVQVVPLSDLAGTGFSFEAIYNASGVSTSFPDDFFAIYSFAISAPSPVSLATISRTAAAVTVGAFSLGLVNICENGAFTNLLTNACTGTFVPAPGNMLHDGNLSSAASLPFGPVSNLEVLGLFGGGALRSLTPYSSTASAFDLTVGPLDAPEPSSALFIGMGVALLVLRRTWIRGLIVGCHPGAIDSRPQTGYALPCLAWLHFRRSLQIGLRSGHKMLTRFRSSSEKKRSLRIVIAALLLMVSAARVPGQAINPEVVHGRDYTFERMEATRVVHDAEDDGTIRLVTDVYRPLKNDRHEVVLFSHGSTGGLARSPKERADAPPIPIINFFVSRGYTLVAPMRRGRGESTGTYVEECSVYIGQCTVAEQTALTDRSLREALLDTRAVIDQLILGRLVARESRIIAAGISRGGFLSLILAGEQPELVKGAINFVGGWQAVTDRLPPADYQERMGQQTALLARAAKRTRAPSIWFYAVRDPFYKEGAPREFLRSWQDAGGRAEYVYIGEHSLTSGHMVASNAAVGAPGERISKLTRRREALKNPVRGELGRYL